MFTYQKKYVYIMFLFRCSVLEVWIFIFIDDDNHELNPMMIHMEIKAWLNYDLRVFKCTITYMVCLLQWLRLSNFDVARSFVEILGIFQILCPLG